MLPLSEESGFDGRELMERLSLESSQNKPLPLISKLDRCLSKISLLLLNVGQSPSRTTQLEIPFDDYEDEDDDVDG